MSEKEHHEEPQRAPGWLRVSLFLLLSLGVLRALLLLAHQPLVALANSYDEVRYTACFDLYPDRPADVAPTRNSPEAPYARYRFIPSAAPICYWSSELGFQALTAAIYRIEQTFAGAQTHSVRWIGALKFGALLLLAGAFVRAHWRRGEFGSALAHAALLPLLFADPADAIYLDTFYAEWTALLALYALCGLILLDFGRAPSRARRVLLAFAAFALATSKIQHLLLPLVCGMVVLLLGFWHARRWPWQGKAIALGAIAGLALQGVQLGRDSDAIRAIDMFNRSDVAFTGLLPNARDPAATAERLGIDPLCLRFIGLRAWQMSDYPGHACPSLEHLTRTRELAALLREPDMAARLGWNGVLALDPWLAPGLGLVEGGNFAPLPADLPTLSTALTAARPLRLALLAAPLVAALVLLLGPSGRRYPRLQLFSALAATIMLASLGVTLLGDGLADTPKQGHLVLNTALAWWICLGAFGLARLARRR